MKKGNRWYGANCRIVTTNGPAGNPADTDFDFVREKILRTFKTV